MRFFIFLCLKIMKENLIQNKTFEFSKNIIVLYIELKNKKEFVLSKQLLRSSTSIGANVEEAIAGQSKKDFLNKITISLKEARETKYWLRLLAETNLVNLSLTEYLSEIESIINILTKISKTTSNNL